MSLVSIIDNTEDYDDLVKKYFGNDYNKFFDILSKQGLIDRYIHKFIEEDDLFGTFMPYYYNEDPQFVIDYITETFFGDVKNINGQYWMNIDREDLSRLFDEDRWGGGARGIARKVLSDNIDEFFSYVDIHDLYNDVISELDKDNILKLREAVYSEVEGKEVTIDGEKDIITREQIMEMDENELSDFIKENADDVYSELRSLYNSSYESAYYDEVYDLIYRELHHFFGTKDLFRTVPTTKTVYDKESKSVKEIETTREEVNVTNILPTVIKDVLDWGGYDADNDFQYHGSFEGILNRWAAEDNLIDFRIPEYADWGRTRDNMNLMFGDYI